MVTDSGAVPTANYSNLHVHTKMAKMRFFSTACFNLLDKATVMSFLDWHQRQWELQNTRSYHFLNEQE